MLEDFEPVREPACVAGTSTPFGLSPNMVFDLSRPDQVWVRLNHKIQTQFFGTTGYVWNEQSVADFLPRVTAFGVSDKPDTIYTEYSWLIEAPKFSAGRTVCYGQHDTNVPLIHYLTNILNGLTPTGTPWSIDYAEAYVWFSGLFKTFGNWTSMYEGANWTSHIQVNTATGFRCGGHIHHTGEFIHTSCNGYGSQDHSITSRANWQDQRFFWFRFK
jgi:hypothetical protein